MIQSCWVCRWVLLKVDGRSWFWDDNLCKDYSKTQFRPCGWRRLTRCCCLASAWSLAVLTSGSWVLPSFKYLSCFVDVSLLSDESAPSNHPTFRDIWWLNYCIFAEGCWTKPCFMLGPDSTRMDESIRVKLLVWEIYLSLKNHPGQLSLTIPPWKGSMSTGQRAVMFCGWGVKAVWLVFDGRSNCVIPCTTRVISECFRI